MTMHATPTQNLRSDAAARYLGISTSKLAKWRMSGDGPPFAKLGRRVVYRRADLEAWLAASLRTSTSPEADDGLLRYL